MKKTLIAIITLLCIAAFSLTACGGSGSGGTEAAGSGNAGGGSAAETYDVGAFTMAVPAGWTVFPQNDMFGEKDADGNYPVDPETIYVAKGVSDEMTAMISAPGVRIYYYGPDTYVMDTKGFYDNVKDLEDVTINGVACSAYEGESLGYVYQVISYPTDTAKYEILITTSIEGKDTGITWEDPDVKSILESLTAE